MDNQNTTNFEPACKEALNPQEFVSDIDDMPPEVRKALHNAQANWCAACISLFYERRLRKNSIGQTTYLTCKLIQEWDADEIGKKPPTPLEPLRKKRKPIPRWLKRLEIRSFVETDMREWNPLWEDVVEVVDNSNTGVAYVMSVRRMILASISWIEKNDSSDLQWQERDIRGLATSLGIPENVPIEQVAILGIWTDFFRPSNEVTQNWFDAITEACEQGNKDNTPSVHMMKKAIACGMMVSDEGFDAFNMFMCQRHQENYDKPN